MDNLSVFGDIGNVLGYPAMLLIFWLYMKIKDMQKRLDDGDLRFKDFEKSLGKIKDDVSFIRGYLEGQEKEDKK